MTRRLSRDIHARIRWDSIPPRQCATTDEATDARARGASIVVRAARRRVDRGVRRTNRTERPKETTTFAGSIASTASIASIDPCALPRIDTGRVNRDARDGPRAIVDAKVGIGSMDDEVDGVQDARRGRRGRNGGDGLDVGRTRADVGTASVLTRGAVPLRVDAGTNGVADAATRTRAADIVKNAKTRWLRNTEVCDALLNYVAYGFEASAEAPMKPRAGTLYLINRRWCFKGWIKLAKKG